MVIAAHFEEFPSTSGKARDPRRLLRLEAVGVTGEGDSARVLVHNISASGLLLESAVPLVPGERIDVELPHVGPTAARIVWASGGFFGCQFDAPISTAALSAAQLRSDPPEPTHETFASRLKRLRKERRLSMAQLAAQLGVSKPTIWAWEQGKARPVQARMEALAQALEVPAPEMLTDPGEPLSAVTRRAREQIAGALGIAPDKIRIVVDL